MRTPSARDIAAFRFVNQRATHRWLDWTLARLTHVGLGGVQLPIVAFIAWSHRDQPGFAGLWSSSLAAFVVATILVHLLKRRVKRLRPVAHTEVRFLAPVTRHGSFPSGHTATTFALAAVLAWHFPLWSLPLLLCAAVIGYSRIYVGLHFPSDVIWAALIGLASAAASLAFLAR